MQISTKMCRNVILFIYYCNYAWCFIKTQQDGSVPQRVYMIKCNIRVKTKGQEGGIAELNSREI